MLKSGNELPEELALVALRYAAGELPPSDVAHFEARLATEQPAREALADAIRLASAACGQAPRPDVTVRQGVREQLDPRNWMAWLPRRRYRGHPILWCAVGASLTAGVLLAVIPEQESPQFTPVQVVKIHLEPAPTPVAESELAPSPRPTLAQLPQDLKLPDWPTQPLDSKFPGEPRPSGVASTPNLAPGVPPSVTPGSPRAASDETPMGGTVVNRSKKS